MENSMDFLSNQRTSAMTSRTVSMLIGEYANRGIALSVQNTAKEQEENELSYVHALPLVYRLSQMSEEQIASECRHGKATMATRDLVEYIEESRRLRISRNAQGSVLCNEIADLSQRTAFPARTKIKRLPGRVQPCLNPLVDSFYLLNDTSMIDSAFASKKKHFSTSMLTSVAAVFLSAMLVLSGGFLFKNIKSGVKELQTATMMMENEISALNTENNKAESTLQTKDAFLADADALESEVKAILPRSEESTVLMETFDTQENTNIGLSALLSAFGMK